MGESTIIAVLVISLLIISRQLLTVDKKISILEKTVENLESNQYYNYSVNISPYRYKILTYYLDKESDETVRYTIQLAIEDLKHRNNETEKKYEHLLLWKQLNYTHFYSSDWKFSLLRDWSARWPCESTAKQRKLINGDISFESLLSHQCKIDYWYFWFCYPTWNDEVNKETFLYTFPYSKIAEMIRINLHSNSMTNEIIALANTHWYSCNQDEINYNHFEFKNEFVTYFIGVTDMG